MPGPRSVGLLGLVVGFLTLWRGVESRHGRHVDHIILGHVWPASECRYYGREESLCNRIESSWKIGELSPLRKNSDDPQYCNDTVSINLVELDPIKKDLTKNWPSILKSLPDSQYWTKIYSQHGTCGLGIPFLNGTFLYFNFALDKHSQFDLSAAFEAANIYPEKYYSVNNFRDALTSAFKGNEIGFRCTYDHETKETYLKEVYLCFELTKGSFTSCNELYRGFWRDCPPDPDLKNIYFPSKRKPSGIKGSGPKVIWIVVIMCALLGSSLYAYRMYVKRRARVLYESVE